MRIQLTIERNALPTTNILWPINMEENGAKMIVSRLLAKVDEAVPLETAEWPMEDYIVQVNGFECLHYQSLADVLKDDDFVTIRPLQSDEVKARYMLGRSQIDKSLGVHLYDGVPFGRPCLRKPVRPTVKIPPRKRRRVDFEEGEAAVAEKVLEQNEEGQLLIENVDEDEEQLALLNGGFATLKKQVTATYTRPAKKRKADKSVHFDAANFFDQAAEVDSDDDEEDFDFDASVAKSEELDSDESSDVSSGSSSDDSSSDSGSSSDSNSDGSSEADSETEEVTKPPALTNGKSKPIAPTPQVNGILTPAVSVTTVEASKRSPVKESLPGQGKETTSQRNKRRKSHNALQRLKRRGILPPGADHEDLRTYKENSSGSSRISDEAVAFLDAALDDGTTHTGSSNLSPVKNVVSEKTSGVSNVSIGKLMAASVNGVTSGQATRELLYELIETDHYLKVLMNDTEDAPKEMSSKEPTTTPAAEVLVINSPEPTESPAKRARLNVGSAQRHIFGSLGVRTPKSKAEAEKTRAKLVEQANAKKTAPPPAEPAVVEEEPPESDAWRHKIRLTAVECAEDGVELSEPPYPFYQRWDPQQQLQKGGKGFSLGQRKRKRKSRINYGEHAFDDEEEEGNWDYEGYEGDNSALNLDEEDTTAAAPASKKTHSSDYDGEIESQLLNDIRTAFSSKAVPEKTDLPVLPEDMFTLPDAKPEDFIPGAIIAFKQLEMSKATNWAPMISDYLTAEVIEEIDKGGVLHLQLAIRDRKIEPSGKYDNDGNRVYSKFEMAGVSDEDSVGEEREDDGFRELSLMEMRESKVVKKREKDEGKESVESHPCVVT